MKSSIKKEQPMHASQFKYETKTEYKGEMPKAYEDQAQFVFFSDFDEEFDYESLVTEDDEPVDNLFSERQQKLLTDTLYASWKVKRPFLACANVGIYKEPSRIPIVPDMFLSMDVRPAKDIWKKKNRCYMIGVFGKAPELVVEVVSNKVGNERGSKYQRYEEMEIQYYVIFDPEHHIFKTSLHAYQLQNGKYVAYPWKQIQTQGVWLSGLNLGLKVHNAIYQRMDTEWLLWYDQNGTILHSGEEKARLALQRAENEFQRAETEAMKALQAEKRAEKALKELALLKAKLSRI
jgi:Uma2 family endonuclease